MKSHQLAALFPCSVICSALALSPPMHPKTTGAKSRAGLSRYASMMPSARYTRLHRLFLDPYEEQYRKYWGVAEQKQQEQYVEKQVQAEEHIVQPQQRQQRYMPGGTQQYLQHLSSSQVAENVESQYSADSGYESCTDEVTNPNPYGEYIEQSFAASANSYDLQYQQYLENMRQQMIPETGESVVNMGTEESADCPAGDDMTINFQEQSTEPISTEEIAQQEQHIEDIEESFLRAVSNEVNYKKFLNQSPYSLTDINVPLIIQRFLDNIEDDQQKRNGKLKGLNKRLKRDRPLDQRKTVVVLGTGWASHAFIKLASTYDLRIVVVSPVNHFVFTPMLASAAVGTVEYRSMTEPIRVTNPHIDNYVEGRAIGVDVEAKKVAVQLSSFSTVTGAFKGLASSAPCRLEPEPVLTHIIYDDDEASTIKRDESKGAGTVIELNYDYLLCAVGTASRSNIVPGAKEHCFNLKTSQDAKRLRTAIGEVLEFASRPDVQEFYYEDEDMQLKARAERRRRVSIAIVGGGPTGVELAGEMMDFFSQVCGSPDGAFQHLKDDVSITLIHGGPDLIPAMDVELRQKALELLHSQGVEVRLNTRLQEVGRDYITILEKGSEKEETIPVGVTVWGAGNAPVPFVRELLSQLPAEAVGSAGRIKVDEWLRCPTYSKESFGSILVLGDVACFETQAKYESEPEPLPQTAQVAGQQGAYAARLLNRGYDLQQTPPKLPELSSNEALSLLRLWITARGLEEAPGFKFLSLGLLAYVGQEEALNQVMIGQVPIFNYSGKIAFLLWRSVYLAKQASSRNQALIAFDWARTQQFGRDITRL